MKDTCSNGWMNGWAGEGVDGWVDGCLDGWVGTRMLK